MTAAPAGRPAGPRRPGLPAAATIREVGPRDGLQAEAPLTVEARSRLLSALSQTGLRKIEAVSFVSPRAVPAMAGAAEVWAGTRTAPGIAYSALVPNRPGAVAAVRAGGFSSLQSFLAASDGYNRSNVGKSVEESVADVAGVLDVGRSEGLPVEVSISAAFGDPYGDGASPRDVARLAARLTNLGAAGLSLGDTTGMATPGSVWDVLEAVSDAAPGVRINLHLHDTRGTAMANLLAGLEAGCDEFDASIGGLGGSPFAPGANGNVATEDAVAMLMEMGIEVGVDLEALLDTVRLVEDLVGHPVPGHILRAGPAWRPRGDD